MLSITRFRRVPLAAMHDGLTGCCERLRQTLGRPEHPGLLAHPSRRERASSQCPAVVSIMQAVSLPFSGLGTIRNTSLPRTCDAFQQG